MFKFRTRNRSNLFLSILEYIIMYSWLILVLFPFLWILSLALRKTEAVYTALFFPKEYTFENFIYLFEGHFPYRNIQINFFGTMKNSFIVTIVSVVLIIVISTIAAYGFAKIRFFGKNIAFYLILSGIMMPVQVIMLPLMIITKVLQIQNSLFSVIFPYVALGIPLSVFLLTGFFKNIPNELVEAAKIEGCNDWQVLLKIILPLSKPALSANIILQFLFVWNEFALALALLRRSDLLTLPVEISKVQGQYMTPWNIVSVSTICAMLPVLIVYMIFQKQFVAGMTAGALKE